MNYEIMKTILEKIKEYDRIMLFRHIRNDGDCVGSTKGLKRILQLTYPEKEIYLVDSEHSEYLAFLGADDGLVSDEVYADALAMSSIPERRQEYPTRSFACARKS